MDGAAYEGRVMGPERRSYARGATLHDRSVRSCVPWDFRGPSPFPPASRRRVGPAAGYAVCLSLSPCRVCDTEASIVANMPSRLLSRLSGQTFATMSAVRYGLVRHIVFLLHRVSLHAANVVYWRQFASHGAADRAQRVADLSGKIKIARTTRTQKQQSAKGLSKTATILPMCC